MTLKKIIYKYIHTHLILRGNLVSLARSTILLFILYYGIICKYLQIYAVMVVLRCHKGGGWGGVCKGLHYF